MTDGNGKVLRFERGARRAAAIGVSLSVGFATYLWVGGVVAPLICCLFILVTLELSWVAFAFEVTPDYQAVRSIDTESLAGLSCVVLETCAPRGKVRLRGDVWRALSSDGNTIAAGETVVIKKVGRGLVLLVGRA